jgi:dipeptidyl aminopeptidase/acylaminoacyl peptidase
MRRDQVVICILMTLVSLYHAHAQPTPTGTSNGTVVDQRPCAPVTGTYENYVDAAKKGYAPEYEAAQRQNVPMQPVERFVQSLYTREEFEKRQAHQGFECVRITYLSDGLKVVGHIYKPQSTTGKHYPLIIFNRGGNREFGKNTPRRIIGLYEFLAHGFVVLASQYRGNDGGEGKEELGGADMNDVLHLFPLAQSLGYIDMRNIFMYGVSRGGMTTYIALKHGAPVNAAAIVGGVTDLQAWAEWRPQMLQEYQDLIPDYARQADDQLRQRSVIHWVEQVNVPLLILHGGADWRVPPSQALTLAQRLQAGGKVYELIIYARDDHGLSFHREEKNQKIVEWFRAHMQAR